jgi:hypothetical protein
MAGQLTSFLTGGSCAIRIGDTRIAYAQNLSINSRMDHTAVFGIGGYNAQNLEPVSHSVSFSMQIVRYSTTLIDGNSTEGVPSRKNSSASLPENLSSVTLDSNRDGNSLLDQTSFNPQLLLLSSSFDIEVYERNFEVDKLGVEGKLIYLVKDCRLSSYSFNFAPGQLLIENVSGVGRFLSDSEEDKLK